MSSLTIVVKLKRRARDDRGSVVVLALILMVPMLGIAAFAVDVGAWYQAKRQAQSAADAAALAGMQDLPNNPATASTDATTYASKNYNSASAAVTTPYNSDSGQIHVTVTKTVPSILGSLIGTSSVTVTASATAKVNTNNKPSAIFAYDSSCAGKGIQETSNNITVNGAVHSNGALGITGNNNAFGPTTYGGPSSCAGGAVGSNNTFTSGPSVDHSLEPWPNDYTSNSPPCTYSGTTFSWIGSGITIPSGVYCASGAITITGNNIGGTVTLKAASFSMIGNNLSLTPYWNGLAIYQTGASALAITGNNLNGGTVFAPNAEIDVTGNNATTSGFIEGKDVVITGNNFTITGTGAPVGGSSVGYLTQ